MPYTNPLGRTREIVEICRDVWKREAPLVHHGKNFTLPLPPEQGTGLGKPLKIIAHPVRSEIPIWIASLGEKNVELTAEIADGWIPILFIPERAHDVWGAALAAGKAKRDAGLGDMMITAGGLLAIGEGDDVVALRELQRSMVALYVGGMGAKGKNFYNELAIRYGYEKEAELIQDLYLAGKKKEAEAAVPAEFLELTTLCGPEGYVKDASPPSGSRRVAPAGAPDPTGVPPHSSDVRVALETDWRRCARSAMASPRSGAVVPVERSKLDVVGECWNLRLETAWRSSAAQEERESGRRRRRSGRSGSDPAAPAMDSAGGEEIEQVDESVAGATRLDHAGPRHDARHAHAALPRRPLGAAEGGEGRVRPGLHLRTVVGRDHDHGRLELAGALERGDQAPADGVQLDDGVLVGVLGRGASRGSRDAGSCRSAPPRCSGRGTRDLLTRPCAR